MKNGFLYFSLVAALFSSCTHSSMTKTVVTPIDTTAVMIEPDTGCVELSPPVHPKLPSQEYQVIRSSGNGGGAPRFNPSDQDEIMFTDATVIKYNMVSREKKAISVPSLWGRPDWSKTGWIIFNKSDNTLWKIKDNGDSLTQLTSGYAVWPIWDKTGNKMAFSTSSYSLIANEKGAILDTLFYPNLVHRSSWSPDGRKIATDVTYNGKPGIGYIDIDARELHKFSGEGSNSIGAVDWFPDSKTIVWSSDKGLFKTDITTSSTVQLKAVCASRRYDCPSVSSDGTKILVLRVNYKAVVDTLFSTYGIYMMNADGTNEHKIKIPD